MQEALFTLAYWQNLLKPTGSLYRQSRGSRCDPVDFSHRIGYHPNAGHVSYRIRKDKDITHHLCMIRHKRQENFSLQRGSLIVSEKANVGFDDSDEARGQQSGAMAARRLQIYLVGAKV